MRTKREGKLYKTNIFLYFEKMGFSGGRFIRFVII